jgi:surface polysaccharide O-acyltransferase-like enzyme
MSGPPFGEDRIDWKAIAALVVMPIMLVLAFVVSAVPSIPGELQAFIMASLEVVPFVLLALLAYIGTRRTWGKVLTFVWLFLLVGGMALNNIGTAAGGSTCRWWTARRPLELIHLSCLCRAA